MGLSVELFKFAEIAEEINNILGWSGNDNFEICYDHNDNLAGGTETSVSLIFRPEVALLKITYNELQQIMDCCTEIKDIDVYVNAEEGEYEPEFILYIRLK